MIVRELPWTLGRFFEIDSCNAILQPEASFVYFIMTCYCHDSPELHAPEIASVFDVKKYNLLTPFNKKWLHVIEKNSPGITFFENLKKSGKIVSI
jgi:hypothetical protein